MNNTVLLIYRLIYGAFSAIILAGAVRELVRYNGVVAMSQTLLFCLFACAACLPLFASFLFRRARIPLLWAGTVLFCAFFTWYGWYSVAAPFVQHEIHTFDPVQSAVESGRFRMQAGITYGIVMAWFVSLPLIRQFLARAGRDDSTTSTK